VMSRSIGIVWFQSGLGKQAPSWIGRPRSRG
jgi:hypothetical protein